MAAPKEIAELLAVSATDPLSLTPQDVERAHPAIADGVERPVAPNSPNSLRCKRIGPRPSRRPTARLDALRDATTARGSRCARVPSRPVVSGPLPVHADAEPDLRAAARVRSPHRIRRRLRSLRGRIDAALRAVGEDEELAQGLLDRRSELKGRLTAYQAKAARLGLGRGSRPVGVQPDRCRPAVTTSRVTFVP